MNRVSLVVLMACICSVKCLGIGLLLPSSAVHNGSSGLSLLVDVPSNAAYNPASIYSGVELGATYLFNLSELPYYTLHSAFRYNDLGFYIGTNYLGNELYKESAFSLASSYSYAAFSVGAGIRYVYANISNYDSESQFLIDFGLMHRYEKFKGGFSIKNITNAKIEETAMPFIYCGEINYSLIEDASVAVGVEKEIGYDFCFKIASAYRLHKNLLFIVSYQDSPSRIGSSALIDIRKMTLSYGIQTHQYLPITHFVSIGYNFIDDP